MKMEKKGKKEEWWETHGLTRRQAEKILLPQSPHHWRMYARLQPLVPVSRGVLALGGIFLLSELSWGNPDPYWGIVIATGIITLLMILSAGFLYLFQKEKKAILRHMSYRQFFLQKLGKR